MSPVCTTRREDSRRNRGRAVTGTRVEDDVEALGARNCKVERGGRDEVETRRRHKRYLRVEDVESRR